MIGLCQGSYSCIPPAPDVNFVLWSCEELACALPDQSGVLNVLKILMF